MRSCEKLIEIIARRLKLRSSCKIKRSSGSRITGARHARGTDDMSNGAESGDFRIPKPIAAVGILIGGLAAIGVPSVMLGYGVDHEFAVILSLVGLCSGSALILLSVLFGRTGRTRSRTGDAPEG